MLNTPLHTAQLSRADIQVIATLDPCAFTPFIPPLHPVSLGYHNLILTFITHLIPLVKPQHIRSINVSEYPRGLELTIALPPRHSRLIQKTGDTLAALFSTQSHSLCPYCSGYLPPETHFLLNNCYVCPDCNTQNFFYPSENTTQDTYTTTFDAPAAIKALERKISLTGTHNGTARFEKLLETLKHTSPAKPLVTVPEHFNTTLDHLKSTYPNFADVVDFISTHLTLKTQKSPVLSLPPLLLIGPPGIGKSAFCQALATALLTPLHFIDIASAQTGSPLSGSESYWGNTHPGKLFETVVLGPVANPLFILDELDKTTRTQHDPLAALYQLLEKHTAQHFTDLSTEIPFDASHVLWLATANTQEMIPEPLLSRFTTFTIDNPTLQQQHTLHKNLYTDILTHYLKPETPFEKTLNPTITHLLFSQALSPRQAKKALEHAIGKALSDNRQSILPTDFILAKTDSRKFMGFCP